MTPRVVQFTVYGSAKPKGSHDPMLNPHTNEIYLRPASAGLKAWEHQVRTEAARATALNGIFFTGAVRVEIAFQFRRPVSVSAKKRPDMTVAPDIDKTCRSCLDAMTGILWRDDAQVTELVASKAYGAADQPSRVEITVTDAVSASTEGNYIDDSLVSRSATDGSLLQRERHKDSRMVARTHQGEADR